MRPDDRARLAEMLRERGAPEPVWYGRGAGSCRIGPLRVDEWLDSWSINLAERGLRRQLLRVSGVGDNPVLGEFVGTRWRERLVDAICAELSR